MKKFALFLILFAFGFVLPGHAENTDKKIQGMEKQIQDLLTLTQKLQQEINVLKAERAPGAPEIAPIGPVPAVSEEARAQSHVLITGYADVGYRDRDGEDGTFRVGHFNPIFLYRYGDRLLAEAELEVELEREAGEEGETEVKLEFLTLDYVLHEYVTLMAGKFLLPVGVFNERIHPAWRNKLPTKPLPYDEDLIPETDIGVQLRGAANVGEAVVNYIVFGSNGPTSEIEEEVDEAGVIIREEELALDGNFKDNNRDKAFGGRCGIFFPVFGPFTTVETGISGIIGDWDDDDELTYSAIVVDADLHAFENLLELRGEGLLTNFESPEGGDIDRDGVYVQAAYKLAALDIPIVSNTELVCRYSAVRSDEEGEDRDQFTVGGNYYFTNSFLFKIAYDFNDGDIKENDEDVLNLQLAYGF